MGDVVELDEEMKPVRMPVPSGWGTWIIHGDPGGDGRVIVVDSEGVYDSGPIIQPQQHPPPPRQQQQQQPVQKAGKRKGKHVNFQHEDQIKSAAKGNESAHAPEPPQMSAKQLKKLEKASKQAEWKRKQAGEENNGNGVVDDKDQEVVMSGGRGGWPRQPPPRTSPIQPSGPSGWEGEEGLVDNWGPKSVLPDWPGPQFQPMNSPVGRPSSPARRMNSPTDVAKADDDIWAGGGGLGAWPPLMPARPVTSPIMGNQSKYIHNKEMQSPTSFLPSFLCMLRRIVVTYTLHRWLDWRNHGWLATLNGQTHELA
ncbi:hypothetical protein K504DRAFT_459959 [Pleomassaria siparia CBS 279.74]|uniref:Uncharacterized protein n=1 Tax=Pleomassaria siparia CBS 279.74 TaxID=1314801 RepID=A0A6G1K028_9PLEO|nr:hypothetical protein K504DRAFT_459959 [Pleomassaria siparia CBS 279.74]